MSNCDSMCTGMGLDDPPVLVRLGAPLDKSCRFSVYWERIGSVAGQQLSEGDPVSRASFRSLGILPRELAPAGAWSTGRFILQKLCPGATAQ
jgi:hypothetical protein